MPTKRPLEEKSDTPTESLEPLTADEIMFINAYFEENMVGVRAWMRNHPKASYDSARSSASDCLARANVKAEISRRLDEMAMPANEALARLASIARAEHLPFVRFDDDGFVYFNFADPEARAHMHLIKKIKTKRERRIDGKGKDAELWEGEWVEVELHDAQPALVSILKMHGKFVEKVDLTSGGKPIMTEDQIKGRVAQLFEEAEKRKNAA